MSQLLQRIRDRDATVAVLGQGYVGLAVAVEAAEAGFDVVGIEADPDRAASLAAGHSYIEDVSDERLQAVLAGGYRPTGDPDELDSFDIAVISVPTPLHDGAPDLSFIEDAAAALGPHATRGSLVVLESTTYPGTTEELVGPAITATSPDGLVPGEDFLLAYSPERIDPGNTEFGLANTPKVVAGIDEASLQAVDAFFSTFVDTTVPVSSCGVGELCKVLENTFRHVNIALVNEMAKFADDLGVDAFEAIEAAATKPFGFMRFVPGPGVGGHCLPIDPTYLAWQVRRRLGEAFRFVELANEVNESMPGYVVRRLQAALNRDRKAVNGSKVVLLGLAYKPNVGDARETPALPIIDQLVELGAEVVAVDPYAEATTVPAGVEFRDKADRRLLEACDLAVIVTDHDAFDYPLVVEAAPRVFDARNRLVDVDAEHVERL